MEPDSNHIFTSKLPHKQSRCNRQLWLNPTDINYVLTRHLPRSSSVSAQTCQTFTFFLKYSSSSWLPESRLLFALFAFAAAPLVIKHPRVSESETRSRQDETKPEETEKERKEERVWTHCVVTVKLLKYHCYTLTVCLTAWQTNKKRFYSYEWLVSLRPVRLFQLSFINI